jgi:hypothetical protein
MLVARQGWLAAQDLAGRHALAGDHFEPTVSPGTLLAGMYIPAVQADRQ